MPDHKRSDHRKENLDASLDPLYHALMERANRLDAEIKSGQPIYKPEFMGAPLKEDPQAYQNVLRPLLARLSAEYRDLAEELHHW